MSTVTKLGAYGLAVAAAFAVAFAVLVTAPRSSVDAQTATDNVPAPDVVIEAYTESGGGADDNDDANDVAAFGRPAYGADARDKRGGQSVIIQVTDLGPNDGDADPPEAGSVATLFRFNVDSSSTASGVFKSGGNTSLTCADGRTCDLDSDTDDIIVQFDIADDAANGTDLVINVTNVDDNKNVRVVFSVNAALSASKLTVDLTSRANNGLTRPAQGDIGDIDAKRRTEAEFTVDLLDNQQTPERFEGQKLTVTTTRGLIRSSGFATPNCPEAGVSSCTVTFDESGGWVSVRGTGTPGPATVTFEAGGFTVTKEIIFYGSAKKITAEAEQGSVEVGGKVFIVVTVADGAGNGLPGQRPAPGTGKDAVKGPSDNAVRVMAVNNVPKDLNDDGDVDDTGEIPACGNGTDGKGKCVIQVEAPNQAGTANDATRGAHTVTVVSTASTIAAADRKQAVIIRVAGAVDSVSTDAPDRVDSGSTTSIVVTVVDDEGVRAGAQTVEVTQVAGSGVTRNGGPAVTKDGQHTFTYRAANRTDTVEFDIQVRANTTAGAASTSGKSLASLALTIAVGDEPAPPAPEQPTADGITSDAPDRVDPGSSTDITVTVTDADGEPAGMQSVTATQVSGDGRVINGGPAATTDGEYTFTFRAAGTTGTAEIDIDVRSLDEDGAATTTGRVLRTLSLTIEVGEPAPEPAAMAFTPGVAGTALQITNFRGGSISDLQGALLEECSSGVVAFATTAGGFVGYIPGARLSAPNAAFRALFPDDSVPAGQGLIVVNCAGS